ncbi:MAG: DUF1491 family protein [Pseudomonadota bacterium]
MSGGLTTDFWVAAYMARLEQAGIYAHLARRGERSAGAVAVKCATMDGRVTIYTRSYDADGQRIWAVHLDRVAESEAEASLERQIAFDRDLWIVEIEDPRGRHLLEEEGLG